jgi:hypothetical protein
MSKKENAPQPKDTRNIVETSLDLMKSYPHISFEAALQMHNGKFQTWEKIIRSGKNSKSKTGNSPK